MDETNFQCPTYEKIDEKHNKWGNVKENSMETKRELFASARPSSCSSFSFSLGDLTKSVTTAFDNDDIESTSSLFFKKPSAITSEWFFEQCFQSSELSLNMFQIIQRYSSIDEVPQLQGSLYDELNKRHVVAIDDEKGQKKAMDQLTLLVTRAGDIRKFVSKSGILNAARIHSSNLLRKFSHRYSQNQTSSAIVTAVDRSSGSVDSISYTTDSSGGLFLYPVINPLNIDSEKKEFSFRNSKNLTSNAIVTVVERASATNSVGNTANDKSLIKSVSFRENNHQMSNAIVPSVKRPSVAGSFTNASNHKNQASRSQFPRLRSMQQQQIEQDVESVYSHIGSHASIEAQSMVTSSTAAAAFAGSDSVPSTSDSALSVSGLFSESSTGAVLDVKPYNPLQIVPRINTKQFVSNEPNSASMDRVGNEMMALPPIQRHQPKYQKHAIKIIIFVWLVTIISGSAVIIRLRIEVTNKDGESSGSNFPPPIPSPSPSLLPTEG